MARNGNAVQASISLLGYAEGQVEDLQYKIKHLRRELAEAESKLVGARETIRHLREQVRIDASKEVREELTSRDVEILRARGYVVSHGDVITPDIKSALRQIGMEPGGSQ